MLSIVTLSMIATLTSTEVIAVKEGSIAVTEACGAMAAVAEGLRGFAAAVSIQVPLAELRAGVMRAGLNRADGPALAVAAAFMAAGVAFTAVVVVVVAANRGLVCRMIGFEINH
jgi:hypothetical protein